MAGVACGSSGGMIAARNAAQKALAFSPSITETAPRVLSLQRDFLRSVPWVKRAYNVPMTEARMRSLLTQQFRDKKNATDVHTVNRLVVQGRMELDVVALLLLLLLHHHLLEKSLVSFGDNMQHNV